MKQLLLPTQPYKLLTRLIAFEYRFYFIGGFHNHDHEHDLGPEPEHEHDLDSDPDHEHDLDPDPDHEYDLNPDHKHEHDLDPDPEHDLDRYFRLLPIIGLPVQSSQ